MAKEVTTTADGPGNPTDILRAFVNVCEKGYAENYHEAAGEEPNPIDPQQVAEGMDEDVNWPGLSQAYLSARAYLDGAA